jgi:phenylpyruvate tautomerase PptA (4-oxalocrotonate tautomerase family)
MPIIEVKAFAHRFEDEEKAKQLIAGLTEAFGAVYGEEAQRETEVLLHGISPQLWGFGGTTRA